MDFIKADAVLLWSPEQQHSSPSRKPTGNLKGHCMNPLAHGCSRQDAFPLPLCSMSARKVPQRRGLIPSSVLNLHSTASHFRKRSPISRRWCQHTSQLYEAFVRTSSPSCCRKAPTLWTFPSNSTPVLPFMSHQFSPELTATPCAHTEVHGIWGGNIKVISIFLLLQGVTEIIRHEITSPQGPTATDSNRRMGHQKGQPHTNAD